MSEEANKIEPPSQVMCETAQAHIHSLVHGGQRRLVHVGQRRAAARSGEWEERSIDFWFTESIVS
jgi:hypothetical protein